MPPVWSCGSILEVRLAGIEPEPVLRFDGIIDTGASVICVDQRIALQLNLTQTNKKFMRMADGSKTRATGYLARVIIPELNVDRRLEVFGMLMAQASDRVLLGRSFLSRYYMTYEGPTETFKFVEALQRSSFNELDEHDE